MQARASADSLGSVDNTSLPPSAGPPVPDPESLAFEAAAVVAVTAGLSASLTPILAGMLSGYELLRAAGSPTPASAGRLRGAIVAALQGLRWRPMLPALERIAREAVELGVDRATRRLPPAVRSRVRPARERSLAGLVLPDIDADARRRLDEAAALAGRLAMTTKRDVEAVVSKAHGALSGAQGAARSAANGGINAGTAETARQLGRRLLWVAETNACLDCLALAGYVVEPGDEFPAARTFAARAMQWVPDGGLRWPPRHPNCRCQVRLYDGPAGPPSPDIRQLDPAARLAGEARRSVARGWSSYDSLPARLDAVTRLLAEGANLPVTVERRAARDAARGRFSTRHLPRARGRVT